MSQRRHFSCDAVTGSECTADLRAATSRYLGGSGTAGQDLSVLEFRWLFEARWGSPESWRVWILQNRSRIYGEKKKNHSRKSRNKVVAVVGDVQCG